jgi:hypothetical protein
MEVNQSRNLTIASHGIVSIAINGLPYGMDVKQGAG